MLSLPQLPAMCVSFLGTLLDLGGVQHGNQLSQLLCFTSQGQLWGPNHLSMGVWGWGQQPAHQLIVRQASQRLRLIQAQKHGILTPGASVCRPRLLPLPGSDQTSAQVLQGLESRWTASLQASPSGRDRLSSDLPDSQPAWMAPSGGRRQHWSERQQQQQAQQQQPVRWTERLLHAH